MLEKPLNKTEKRITLERLERLYKIKCSHYTYYHENQSHRNKQTIHERIDRKMRLQIKALEMVLHDLDSKLFENVGRPSFRKSKILTHVDTACKNKTSIPRHRGVRTNYTMGKI